MTGQNETIIGYSGFEVFEECYGYNENACFIADSEVSADSFMQAAALSGEYRIEPVTLPRIMDDYGYSLGEYAMEREAFARFRAAANEAGVKYQASQVDFGPELTVVEVEGVKVHKE